MAPAKNDFSTILKHMEIAYQDYFRKGSTYSVIKTEIMKVSHETGDVFMEDVSVVLLNPAMYEILKPILPILHEPQARQVWIHVMEKTLAELGKSKNGAT